MTRVEGPGWRKPSMSWKVPRVDLRDQTERQQRTVRRHCNVGDTVDVCQQRDEPLELVSNQRLAPVIRSLLTPQDTKIRASRSISSKVSSSAEEGEVGLVEVAQSLSSSAMGRRRSLHVSRVVDQAATHPTDC
jgi:hypothetical protein